MSASAEDSSERLCTSQDGDAGQTLGLCFAAALLEGADIVSMGLATPQVAVVFRFTSGQMGLILAAAVVGQIIGAAYGGWLADRIGRRRVLVWSFVVLGIFSLGTIYAHNLNEFVAVRFLAGLGIGGAFPTLVAIAGSAARLRNHATGIGIMYCGQPIGGALLGLLIALVGISFKWSLIFQIGGVGPLVLAPILWIALPDSARAHDVESRSIRHAHPMSALFSGKGGSTTPLLWISFFFSLMIVYVINTWLPGLLVIRGFKPPLAFLISSFENLGAAAGSLTLARLFDRGHHRKIVAAAFIGIVFALVALGTVTNLAAVIAAAVAIGFFAIGGQLVLYALASSSYPDAIRATGVGAAIAIGRIGAIVGPVLVGSVLSAGYGSRGVVAVVLPGIVAAGAAVFALTCRLGRSDLDARAQAEH